MTQSASTWSPAETVPDTVSSWTRALACDSSHRAKAGLRRRTKSSPGIPRQFPPSRLLQAADHTLCLAWIPHHGFAVVRIQLAPQLIFVLTAGGNPVYSDTTSGRGCVVHIQDCLCPGATGMSGVGYALTAWTVSTWRLANRSGHSAAGQSGRGRADGDCNHEA